MNIILIGYMASGKSTIGKLLAKLMDFKFLDLDDYIEKKEKCTVTQIFETKGEVYFRKLEHKALKELVSTKDKHILSLGGGTPCYAGNMDLIKVSGNNKSIYLKASINELVNRLLTEKDQRPLVARLKNKEELTEFIGKHLFERNPFYNQADISIAIDQKSEDDIVKEIISKLY